MTLLFCDVARFTEMTERLGDLQACSVVEKFRRIVRRQLQRYDGEAVEVRGDGFLFGFPTAASGLSCAVALQVAVGAAHGPPMPVQLRMGVHTGAVLRDGDRYFGKTVIVAARIASLAEAGEVLVSSTARVRAGPGHFVFTPESDVRLKGLRGRYRIAELVWRAATSRPGRRDGPEARSPAAQLALRSRLASYLSALLAPGGLSRRRAVTSDLRIA